MKYLNRLLLLSGVLALSELVIGLSNVIIYSSSGAPFNLGLGVISVCLGLLIGSGYLRLLEKKRRLKREQQLFE